ncbi:MAG: hypothetical protein IT455_02665 [Planctomycetes bacterium]|nr:hypothetical protein [Planctomycetota bacterium]
MHPIRLPVLLFLAAGLAAQTTGVFPADYTAVAEGPQNSPNLPLANGTSRVLIVYDQRDLPVPAGAAITRLGFRQDATLTTMDAGKALQLEVRMGYTTNSAISPSTTFDANYHGAPRTVFGPALFTLPNLRDAQNPLPDGRFFIDLTTPFVYQPNGRNLVVEYRVLGNSAGGAAFSYRLDRADYYSPTATGVPGCQHSGGGVPQLGCAAVRTGLSETVTGTTCPANTLGVVFLNLGEGLAPTPFPLTLLFPDVSASCMGQLLPGNLATLSATTSPSGGLSISYAIPANEAFYGLVISHQALFLDLFAPGGLVASNAAQVRVGTRPRTAVVAAQGPPASLTTGTLTQHFAPVAFFTWL